MWWLKSLYAIYYPHQSKNNIIYKHLQLAHPPGWYTKSLDDIITIIIIVAVGIAIIWARVIRCWILFLFVVFTRAADHLSIALFYHRFGLARVIHSRDVIRALLVMRGDRWRQKLFAVTMELFLWIHFGLALVELFHEPAKITIVRDRMYDDRTMYV